MTNKKIDEEISKSIFLKTGILILYVMFRLNKPSKIKTNKLKPCRVYQKFPFRLEYLGVYAFHHPLVDKC